jgi:hypothetical protein
VSLFDGGCFLHVSAAWFKGFCIRSAMSSASLARNPHYTHRPLKRPQLRLWALGLYFSSLPSSGSRYVEKNTFQSPKSLSERYGSDFNLRPAVS